MESSVTQRVKQIMTYLNLSETKFAKELGVTQSTINAIIKRNGDVKTNIITAIIKQYPLINLPWLLTGTGKMLNDVEAERTRDLSRQQIHELLTMQITDYKARYLDAFRLVFYLIGINMIDLCRLTKIERGYINYIRAKTSRPYSIKVEPEAMEIIDKYRGQKYLIDVLERYSDYRTFVNRELKKIEGYDFLTVYYAQHTWATMAAELDMPKETIAAALGHGGYSVTDIYINFDKSKIAAANRRVIDYVLK
jgi:plasmid maintenance system antidote protein VapI